MRRVIIDCDPGNGITGANVDDGLALALALGSPDISLELITTVAGNTPSDIGFNVAMALVTQGNLKVPVYQGAEQALVEPAQPWREALDNRVYAANLAHLWRDVASPQVRQAPSLAAADAIGQLICANPGEITLVAIGPLTNVALAMARYPAMIAAVQEIVIMGGVFTLDDYIKDTNFGLDPEAAQQVLTSGARITLVPMDVTTQTMLTRQDLQRFASIDGWLARYVCETLRPWLEYSMQTRNIPGCWIHDALVVAWLINPQVATAADYYVDVEVRPGMTRGKAWRFRPPLRVDVAVGEPTGSRVQVLKTVDNPLLLTMLEQALKNPP
ncbi:nucleoside hydrolase [Erwinia mallotivora]|uniref:Hydrolase n=1 Tax=Erwinia mallotivora TaxID=69222 RepID=A0A014PU93_9GAMM|nr:nucleoside hydrolase [Erwinia mallotivora]EXU74427.1 hydrolase [Erwinia mallotivora]